MDSMAGTPQPGEVLRENTDEVLQDEHLSDQDNLGPLGTGRAEAGVPAQPQVPLSLEAEAWDETDFNRNRLRVNICKVTFLLLHIVLLVYCSLVVIAQLPSYINP